MRLYYGLGKATPLYWVASIIGMDAPYLLLIAFKKVFASNAFPSGVRCTPSREKAPPATKDALMPTPL